MSSRPRTPQWGEIWDTYLDPVVGREQGGRQPVLVVSSNRFNNSASQLCMILPLTARDRGILTHLLLSPPEGGLNQPSFILCDQIRTVSQERLKRFRGKVSAKTVTAALHVIGIMLESEDE